MAGAGEDDAGVRGGRPHGRTAPWIKWAWVSIANRCAAFVGAFMMEAVRERKAVRREMVVRDSLTGLYDRHYVFRLRSEIRRAKRCSRTLSLLFLDVDDFKKVNDEHGHLAGDEVLRILAGS